MRSGYSIHWTKNALNELQKTIEYLETNFTVKELQKLSRKIETTTRLISQNPNLFPKSEDKNIHKAVIMKYNTMYYRVTGSTVEILSFFSNRQHPSKKRSS